MICVRFTVHISSLAVIMKHPLPWNFRDQHRPLHRPGTPIDLIMPPFSSDSIAVPGRQTEYYDANYMSIGDRTLFMHSVYIWYKPFDRLPIWLRVALSIISLAVTYCRV
jgi:hypothetical protein